MINSQGYNFGGGGSSSNGFSASTVDGTKKYIMSTKTLLGTTETSTLSEAARKPTFDPYRTPEHRMEYSLYGGEYYCASDVKIYIGDIWIDDALSIEYVLQEKVTPVFGYGSFTYDDIARGQRTVMGSLSINFKTAGYMQKVLKYADAIMYALKVGENNGSIKPMDYQNYKLSELLIKLGKKSFEEISSEYEKALWGDMSEDSDNLDVLNHDLMPHFPYSNLGFDIRIHFGPVDEVMKDTGLSYYADTYNVKEPEYTVEVINGVQFMSVRKIIGTDQQSTPIMEGYDFIARDLNGISKDRFIAQMEFDDMDADGTMFGNANSTLINAPYSEILGYEKAEYSSDNVNVSSAGGYFEEVQFVKNDNGDSAQVYVKSWGKNTTVNLIGVDSYDPKVSDPKKKDYAAAAKSKLERLLSEASLVKLEFEGDRENKVINSKGEYSTYVHIDGELVNVILAKEGLVKSTYSDVRHGKEIRAAEEEARLAKRGLWATLPQEPHEDLTFKELEAFFKLAPELSGNLTAEQWKAKK